MRYLNADEISLRINQVKAPDPEKDKKGFITLLLYKNARVDAKVFDEEYGKMNWQNDFKEVKGTVYCTVSVWDEVKKQWISKTDAGAESNIEAEKGEASDAFKRACSKFGCGAELYTAPDIVLWYAPNDVKLFEEHKAKLKYAQLEDYKVVDGKIVSLRVVLKGKTLYEYNNIPKTKKPVEKPKNEQKTNTTEPTVDEEKKMSAKNRASINAMLVQSSLALKQTKEELLDELDRCLKQIHGKSISDIDDNDVEFVINTLTGWVKNKVDINV